KGKENKGMPEYNVHTMLVSLHLTDNPVGYTPPIGIPMQTKIAYNQREGNQLPANPAFFNMGEKWIFNWLAFIEDNPSATGSNLRRMIAGGGAGHYGFYSSGFYQREEATGAILERTADGKYTRHLINGAKEKYEYSDGATSPKTFRRIFLSEIIDSKGNS